MVQAFRAAEEIVSEWCAEHRDSFPPIVINLTDGEATDGDPTAAAASLCQSATDDGPTLLFNLHLAPNSTQQSVLPSSDEDLPGDNAARLFNMSSVLPPTMLEAASALEFGVAPQARGFMYNADATHVIEFLDIGTRAVTPTGLKELTGAESTN